MYHSSIGLMHLFWVLFSFFVGERLFFFTACSIMLPIYTWEFIIMYGMRTPGIRNQEPFLSCAEYFVNEMAYPVLEQALSFVILILLFLSIGSLKVAYELNSDDIIRRFFSERIENHHHVMWKVIFISMRYIHYLVLLLLFLNGKDINQLRNLGFMCFFTAYVSSEWLYRKTIVALNIFIAFFVFGQYYFSLTYYRYY